MSDQNRGSAGDLSRSDEASTGIHQILGDFDLQHRIGEGGSAVVYRAVNRTFNGVVAVKVWRTRLTDSQRRKFLDECKLQWKLSDHPNVVRLYWADAPPDSPPWLATELYETSLAQRVFTDPALTRGEIMKYADDILSGLAVVHAEKMLHRDVKPANVLLKGGTAALGDLGITMPLDGVTRDGAAGTDAFLAPELLRGAPPSFRSDVFSAAVTIRFMFGDDVPPEIETVLTRAASHNAHDRPPNAEAMRAQLRQAERAVTQREALHGSPVGGAPGAAQRATGGTADDSDPSADVTAPQTAAPASTAPRIDASPAGASATSPALPPSAKRSSSSRLLPRGRGWTVLAALLLVAAGGAYAAERAVSTQHQPRTASTALSSAAASPAIPSTAPASSQTAVEQCSSDVKKNPQWVCLTQAILTGNQLVLLYNSNFQPSSNAAGHHLHIFSAQLTDAGLYPSVSTFGMQGPTATQGSWWMDYQAHTFTLDLTQPSASASHKLFNRQDPYVCLRVATQDHGLVHDLHGGYDTGNCAHITIS